MFSHSTRSVLRKADRPWTHLRQRPLIRLVSHEATSNEEAPSLPPLSRPLGVREYPTTILKSRVEKLQNLMDQDVRLAQRRHLIKEASKGYFNDLNATRRHGGKTWIAPSVMIKEDKALYLPNISGNTLDKNEKRDTTIMCAGRVSIIAMLSTAISDIHARGFTEATLRRFQSHPSFQYLQINIQENLLKSFVVNIFMNNLRRSVPTELHSTYLISNQNMEYLREPLSMTNSKIGYVYLVDENLKIRWGGCADATAEEAQALANCTGVLLNRLDKRLGNLPKKAMDSQEPPKSPIGIDGSRS